MFAVHLRRLYRPCDRIIIRNLRSKKGWLEPTGANPGLDERIQAFKKDGIQITDDDAEEYIEQSESEFYKIGEVYNEHMNETLMGKYELRHRIVKEKYFKENMPNLLTWSEKEQIRHLATTQPDEWTPDRISESFPVTVPVVKKLLKYPWKPATEQRIARHDASVMRNWKELKEGSLDIPENLQTHFLKFSERSIPPLNKKSIKIDITQDDKIGEFEKIVQRCAANMSAEQDISDNDEQSTSDANRKQVRKDPKRVTLEELSEKIQRRLEKGNNVDMPDQIIVNTINSRDTETVTEKVQEIELYNDREENSVAEYKASEDESKNIMDYPERIRIPKKAYKRGATYKINDCYYDHDGRFLYRVLGMTN